MKRRWLLALVATTSLPAQPIAFAQDADTAPRPPSRPLVISPDSPRASLETFLNLARRGAYDAAGAYLDAPDIDGAARATRARQLKAVLDRRLWVDLDDVSPLGSGNSTDGLGANIDQLGTIASSMGSRIPVRLVKTIDGGEARWRFSRTTMQSIPDWYASLGDRWIMDHIPLALQRSGPFDMQWWQWLALPLVLSVAVAVGWAGSRVLQAVAQRVTRRTIATWDDTMLERLAPPITVACTLMVVAVAVPLLGLNQPAADAAYRLVRAALVVVAFWAIWRLIDVARRLVARSAWASHTAGSRSLLPLGVRSAKVAVSAVAAVSVLSLLGYPVASLIAGLGLGGLALALAAQKTVENVFGAFSIGIDQPFREGDFVKIEDFVGTVEAIGLRSTRFRTLDRTLVTIPNGRLADMRLESFTARDRLRLATVIGLVYETTGDQMREALAGFEAVLRAHPKIWPDAVVVRFREFAASSLDIEIMAWFRTADWGEFQTIRQEILLSFMHVVETAGTAFAYPTHTIHVASSTSTMPSRDADVAIPR
ncbi:MAG TPA: mechanosensitive ion channel domain-containing protein [Gemmatimonadaceae bacterium]